MMEKQEIKIEISIDDRGQGSVNMSKLFNDLEGMLKMLQYDFTISGQSKILTSKKV